MPLLGLQRCCLTLADLRQSLVLLLLHSIERRTTIHTMKIQLALVASLAAVATPVAAQDANTFVEVYNLIDQSFDTGRTLVRLAFQ